MEEKAQGKQIQGAEILATSSLGGGKRKLNRLEVNYDTHQILRGDITNTLMWNTLEGETTYKTRAKNVNK